MVLCAKRRHDLIDSIERAGHESWVKKNEVDLSSQMHGPAQQSLRCRSGDDIACGARVQAIKSGKRNPIIESDFLASDPHFGKMRFQLDHIGIARHPSIRSKQRAGARAENDVVLENRAILIRAVRNDLPTRAVAQETANLSSAQRAFGDRAARQSMAETRSNGTPILPNSDATCASRSRERSRLITRHLISAPFVR